MKKLTLFSALIVCFISIATAQENTLFWKISGNGLEKPSYLLGTMHMLCNDEMVKKPALQDALSSSETVVLELNPTDPALLQEMQQLSVNPNFQNSYTGLPEEDYKLLDEFLTVKYGSGLAQLGILKPFALTGMVTVGYFSCTEPFSLETYFATKATTDNKPVIGLETAGFQISLFDKIPQDIQIQELIRGLKNDQGKLELDQMLEIYISGDLNKLFGLMKENDLMTQFQKELLDDRNSAWIPKLEQLIRSGSAFIAVGAGHLPGEMGVIELLRKKGYTLEVVAI